MVDWKDSRCAPGLRACEREGVADLTALVACRAWHHVTTCVVYILARFSIINSHFVCLGSSNEHQLRLHLLVPSTLPSNISATPLSVITNLAISHSESNTSNLVGP